MENQIKMDARKSPTALLEIRRQIVRLHRNGTGPMAIKEQTGISRGAIRRAMDLFESGGMKALKPKRRGCRKGASRTLTAEQKRQVQKAVCNRLPGQLKMDFALWTREAVLVYIRDHWMIVDGSFNADRLVEFMECLVKEAARKTFLVMDNLKVHHGKPVKEWLGMNKGRIEVFYLPSHSPEPDPDERLNADLKHAITTGVPRRTKDGLPKKTTEHMDMVKSSPERVKSYFGDRHAAYAADSR